MGIYINPDEGTKEMWLTKHGTPVDPEWVDDDETMLICLVDNGMFTAAGVCHDKYEFESFHDPRDGRPKLWFRVPVPKLMELDIKNDIERVLNRRKSA